MRKKKFDNFEISEGLLRRVWPKGRSRSLSETAGDKEENKKFDMLSFF